MQKSLKIFQCHCFEKDLKEISKKIKNFDFKKFLYKELFRDIFYANLSFSTLLFEEEPYKIFKKRINDPSGSKGKRGGLRLIWAYHTEEKAVILIRLYRKSEIENIPTYQLKENFLNCLEEKET